MDELHSCYRMYDRRHCRELTDILELHFIELSKFRSQKPQELQTRFERWLHLLKFGELYQAPAVSLAQELAREEGIEMAVNAMRRASASEEVRELIEARMKAKRNWATQIEEAERLGLEQGREQEREQGRMRLIEMARRMRATGIPDEAIAQLTGLAREEFEP